MSSTVRIAWGRDFDNEQQWNEVCAWAVEYFGLPGDRFHTRVNVHHMDFIFNSNKDALMMALMWNAPIVPNNDLTVEHVGTLINA
jgi:hypothetical protein